MVSPRLLLALFTAIALFIVVVPRAAPVAAQPAAPVALAAGCSNVTLLHPAGTPLRAVAASFAPENALVAVWRYDARQRRFLGFSPAAGAPGDYTATQTAFEAVFACVRAAASLSYAAGDGAGRGPLGPRPPFGTLPPGAGLPGGLACAAVVQRTAWEPRPENAAANGTTGATGVRINGASEPFNARFAGRIDGNFTGTTDEIIQWGACKWGFDEDIVRAVAVQESRWRMSTVGDNGQSYGILQVRRTVHTGTYPWSEQSTAFNVDYALAWRRACFEGDFGWMVQKNPAYAAGDEWGCVGAWFSGNWYDPGAQDYIAKVKGHLAQKVWLQPGY